MHAYIPSTHTYIHIYIQTYMHACIHTQAYIHTYIFPSIHPSFHTHSLIFTHTHYICMYIYLTIIAHHSSTTCRRTTAFLRMWSPLRMLYSITFSFTKSGETLKLHPTIGDAIYKHFLVTPEIEKYEVVCVGGHLIPLPMFRSYVYVN